MKNIVRNKTKIGWWLLMVTLLGWGVLSWGKLKVTAKGIATGAGIVCEDKNGNIKMVADGFSKGDECKNGEREVSFGVLEVGAGEIAFISNDYTNSGYFLLKNGETWKFETRSLGGDTYAAETWVRDRTRDLPNGVEVNDIVQWNDTIFLTKEGDIYKYGTYLQSPKWVKAGNPINNPNFFVPLYQGE